MISASGGWSKYYCQYQAKTKTLTMIPYSQMSGKISNSGCETLIVKECVCKEETSEKFRFVVAGEDRTGDVNSNNNTVRQLRCCFACLSNVCSSAVMRHEKAFSDAILSETH